MKKLFVLSLAALTLFACQKNEAPVQNVPGSPVRFTASMQNTFEFKSVSVESLNGKKVRIAADATLEGATSVATVEGTALTLATPIHWMENQTDPTTFVGIYQKVESGDAADAPADLKVTYEMLTDNYYNYEYHEAYLTATAAEVQPEATANLVFKHPFSKVVVNVTNETENTLEGVVLRDVVLSGTLNLAAQTIEAPGAPARVDMVAGGEGVYEAVIMPVKAQPVIAVTVGEDTYAFALTAPVSFEANKNYTANITISAGTTPVQGETVAFTFDVTDWVNANEAISTQDVTGKWTVFGKFGDAEWADIVMEDKGNYVWEKTITYAVGDEFRFRFSGDSAYQYGMWASDENEYMNPEFSYGMANVSNGLKNIKFEEAGEYKLSLITGGNDAGQLTATKL